MTLMQRFDDLRQMEKGKDGEWSARMEKSQKEWRKENQEEKEEEKKKKDIIDYFVTLIDDHDVRKRPSFKKWVENHFEV